MLCAERPERTFGQRQTLIGVVIPAHNEEQSIGACLASLQLATTFPRLAGETVMPIVVLDSCTDDTGTVAAAAGVRTVRLRARNVGRARAVGARLALGAGARWLAFTDADSVVAPDWLSAQIGLGADAVCGTVTVDDWSEHDEAVRDRHLATYEDRDGHRHVHGANLGVCATAYRRAGGFPPLVCDEDVALVRALQAIGANIAWSAALRVVTSARRKWRAPGGFSATLQRLACQIPASM